MLLTLLVMGLFILAFGLSRLTRRIQALERQLAQLSQGPTCAGAGAAAGPVAAPAPAPVDPAAVAGPASSSLEPLADKTDAPALHDSAGVLSGARATALWSLLKRNLFAVSGIGLLLLGFALLLGSISWGQLLTPTARIVLVLGTALGLGVLGVSLSGRKPLWAQVVQGGAAALAYLGIYVGVASYDLFSTPVALGSFSAIAAWTVWRALKEDSKPLAAIGFLGAYAAPLLALNDQASLALHLSFGLIVTLASLWVSYQRRWLEVASQAYLCVVALAALVFGRVHEPLSFIWQEAFLHAYAIAFVACAVKWLRDPACLERDRPITVAWLGITAGCYLALQYLLLEPPAFTWSIFGIALALSGLAWKIRTQEPRHLGETVWVVAALYAASAIAGADAGHAFKGLVLLAEGLLMLLTLGTSPSVARAGLGRVFLVASALLVLPEAGNNNASIWAIFVMLLASLAGSLVLSQRKRQLDSFLLVGIAVFSVLAAASVLATRLLSTQMAQFPTSYTALFGLLALVLSALAAAICAAASAYRGPWKESLALQGMPAVLWLFTLVVTSDALARWQVLGLVATLGAAVFALYLRHRKPSAQVPAGVVADILAVGVLLVLLLPAIAAFKLVESHGQWIQPLALSLFLLGLAAYALLFSTEMRGARHRLHLPATRLDGFVPHSLLPGVLLCLVPHEVYMAGGLELTPVAVAAALIGWVWSAGEARRGRVMAVAGLVAALAAVVLAYSWPYSVHREAWTQVADTVALAVAWAAVGVGMLFLASRRHDRTMWQLAAGGCVLSLLALAAAAGSWHFSALGGSVALIGIGALFLLAGYLAPMPPVSYPLPYLRGDLE